RHTRRPLLLTPAGISCAHLFAPDGRACVRRVSRLAARCSCDFNARLGRPPYVAPESCYDARMSAHGRASLRLLIVAGAASAGAHAAALVRALRERAPGVAFEFFGATGRALRAAGVETVVEIDQLAIVGLVEIGRA